MSESAPAVPEPTSRTFMDRLLDGIEVVGNKVPHPAVIFLALCGLIIVLSQVLYWLGVSTTYELINPITDQLETVSTPVNGLLTADGIRFLFTSAVANFLGFSAIGVIFVAMVGVGLADEVGLVGALIRRVVAVTPPRALTFVVVFLGVLSSVASDAGYLVLIPLGAAAFLSVGRHPLAGLAAAFAGVAAVFGVNLLITPLDGVLTEITNDAAHLVNPAYTIDLTANLYFSIVSTILMAIVVTILTEKVVEPRLGVYHGEVSPDATENNTDTAENEANGLRAALFALLGVVAVIALLTLPPGAPLRNPQTGEIIGTSPFMASIIVIIMLIFLAAGEAYGRATGKLTSIGDSIAAIEKTFRSLGGLLFLFLVISQFIAYFNYTNMATIAAVGLADLLEHANIGALPLLTGFVLVIVLLDFILPGSIPKWAIFAPIFVPLFIQLGIAPAAVLAAYRVGDSPVNVLTPLMPYFGLIVVFAQRYEKSSGLGTIVAMMLPYTITLTIIWTIVLLLWIGFGLPLGPGVPSH
jgi:aminobenzoyl-glutamate transport protein